MNSLKLAGLCFSAVIIILYFIYALRASSQVFQYTVSIFSNKAYLQRCRKRFVSSISQKWASSLLTSTRTCNISDIVVRYDNDYHNGRGVNVRYSNNLMKKLFVKVKVQLVKYDHWPIIRKILIVVYTLTSVWTLLLLKLPTAAL